MSTKPKNLKKANVAFLTAIVAFDIVALLLVAAPAVLESASFTKLLTGRLLASVALPWAVLFASSLAPSYLKEFLVFWRLKDVLPGHRAFSVHAPADPRIDLAKLKKNVGSFPESPREQNSKWYGLYKQVHTDVTVEDSHQQFLRYRDLASLSVLLAVVAPIMMLALHATGAEAAIAFVIAFVQYLLALIAARQHATRFVTNVLAVHSTSKIAKTTSTGAATAAKKKTA